MRHGEVAKLRWRHYDESTEPLGRIDLGKTKTGVPRAISVHPSLKEVLDEW
jgi:integrase